MGLLIDVLCWFFTDVLLDGITDALSTKKGFFTVLILAIVIGLGCFFWFDGGNNKPVPHQQVHTQTVNGNIQHEMVVAKRG